MLLREVWRRKWKDGERSFLREAVLLERATDTWLLVGNRIERHVGGDTLSIYVTESTKGLLVIEFLNGDRWAYVLDKWSNAQAVIEGFEGQTVERTWNGQVFEERKLSPGQFFHGIKRHLPAFKLEA